MGNFQRGLKRWFSLAIAAVMVITMLPPVALAAPTALIAEAEALLDGRATAVADATMAVADGTTAAQVPDGFRYVTWTEWKDLSRALGIAKKDAGADLQSAVDAFKAARKTGTKPDPDATQTTGPTANMVFHYLDNPAQGWGGGVGWSGISQNNGWTQFGGGTSESSFNATSNTNVNGFRIMVPALNFWDTDYVKSDLQGQYANTAKIGDGVKMNTVPYLQFIAKTYASSTTSDNHVHFMMPGTGSEMFVQTTMFDVEAGQAYVGIPTEMQVFSYPTFALPESTGFGAIRWEILGGKDENGITLDAAQAAAMVSINKELKTITGYSKGEVNIRASVVGGMSNTSAAVARISREFTVVFDNSPSFIDVASVTLNTNTIDDMEVGVPQTLSATVLPEDASNQQLLWTSSNNDIATVSQTGVVTPLMDGTVTIKAASVANANIYDECIVTIQYDEMQTSVHSSTSPGQVQLNWTKPAGDIAGYKIYRDGVQVSTMYQGSYGTWQDVTPTAMRPAGTAMMAADPALPNVLYAFPASDGVWKSEDYGVSFKKISTTAAMNSGMSWGIAVDPNPDRTGPLTMYTSRGYGSGGLWKTTDGGVTWSNVFSNFKDAAGTPIEASLVGSDVMNVDLGNGTDINNIIVNLHNYEYAQDNGRPFGIYETTDGGDSWTYRPVPYNSRPHDDTIFSVGNVWFTIDGGGSQAIYSSDDHGQTWSAPLSLGNWGGFGGTKVVIDGTIYAGGHRGLYISSNNGVSWSRGGAGYQIGSMWASNTRLYAHGSEDKTLRSAPLTNISSFSSEGLPPGYNISGGNPAATIDEDGNYIAVTIHDNKGLLRFVERDDGIIEFADGNVTDEATYIYAVAPFDSTGRVLAKTYIEVHASDDGGSDPEDPPTSDTALYNFENGEHGFFTENAGIALSSSDEQVFAGAKSLKMSVNVSGTGTYYAKLRNTNGVTPGDKITYRVWVPGDANIDNIQGYIMSGSNWDNWFSDSKEYGELTEDAWNTFSFTLPASAPLPLQEIGVEVKTSGGFNGSVYIDSISVETGDPGEGDPGGSEPGPADLSELQIDGATVPGFAGDKLSYTVNVPNGTTSVTVTAVAANQAATVDIIGGGSLAAGANEITVVITAEDGITEQTYTVTVIRALPASENQRITINGTKFYVGGQKEIWINGANTPWNSWNDFGGSFDYNWWDTHFQQLRDAGVNATRIWISSNGEVGININSNGHVSGATTLHWSDLDSLFHIAQSRGIYIMATLLSFDHTKNHHSNYQSWRNMLNSDEHIDSYVDNYVVPFVNRYKANPYLWSIDLMNEPDWVVEEQGLTWDRLQTLFAKMNVAIHENSDVPTTVGVAMVKYNSDTCTEGCQGNKVGDTVLMSKVDGNPLAKVDFWSGHYYDWMGQYWGVPMYITPEQYGMSADRPNVIGETPAKGTTGHTLTEDYFAAYENGWQGIMPWTSNGVDSNGNLSNLAPATSAFYAMYPQLVYPSGDPDDADDRAKTTITLYGADLDFGPLTDDLGQSGPGAAITSNKEYVIPFGAFSEASAGRKEGKDRFYLGDSHYNSGNADAVQSFTLVLSVEDDTVPLPAWLVANSLVKWHEGPDINDIRSLVYADPSDAAKDALMPSVTKVGRDYYLTFDLTDPLNQLARPNGAAWSEHRGIGLKTWANSSYGNDTGWNKAGVTVKSATFTFLDLPEDRREQDMRFSSRPGLDRLPFFNREDIAKPKAGEFSAAVTGANPEHYSFVISDHAVFAPRAEYMHSLYFEITTQAGANIKNDFTFAVDMPSGASQNIAPTRAIKIGENRYAVAVELFESDSGYLGLTGTDTVTLRTTKGADKVVSINAVSGAFLNLPAHLEAPPIAVASVAVSPKTLEIIEGRSRELVAIVSPANAANKSIVWSSSNEAVAVVNQSGKVTAVGVGTAQIIATSVDGGHTDHSDITVTPDPNTGSPAYDPFPTEPDGGPVQNEVITVNQMIAQGTNYKIDLTPYSYKLGALTSVIAVTNANGSNGGGVFIDGSDLVNDLLVGDNYINPTADDGWYGKLIDTSSVTMNIAQDSLVYSDVANRQVGVECWWGGSMYVESITLVFTPSAPGGDTVEVTGVSLGASTLSLNVSETSTLIASIAPSNATNKAVTWSSSNDAVATVSQSGLVTAVNEGTAVITVTTADGGKTATATVTVYGEGDEEPEVDTALFNFESGTHNFTGAGGATLSASNEQAFAGSQSLKVSVNTSGAVSDIYAKLNYPLGLTLGGTYKFRIWVPADANIAGVQPYVMDGNWSWTGTLIEYGELEKGTWNTLSLTIPASAANPINEIGVQLQTSGAFNGSIYIDSIEGEEGPVVEPEPPSPASLRDLQVGGETVPGFASDELSYIVHVPNSATSVTVVAETSDPEATAVIAGGEALAVGENEVTVVVTAADETEQAYTIKVIRAFPAGTGNHITIQGTKFHAGEREIWINGANTPWDNWNDFGGDFDFDWWDNHFQELRDAGVNATRIWISSNGEVGIDIDSSGHVSGATELHWNDLDSLFYIAQKRGIYIMATLLSFDHTKNHHSNYQSWRNMLNSDEHIDSYVDNYVVPFVNRYKANPYLWSIDLMNEPDWVVEEQGLTWDRLQTLFAKMNVAIHENSDVPTTVGIAMVKYNSDTCTEGCQGNKVGDAALMSKVDGNPLAKVDFWSGHYYDWMGQYWGVPMYITPEQYGMSADRPNVIGETPAKGTTGRTLTEDYFAAHENGWQGIMPWTSNGVDSNGNLSNLAPATSAFYALYPHLVYPSGVASNAALSDLRINGTTVAGFSWDEHVYTVNVPNSTTAVEVTAETADTAATVVIAGGSNLAVGENEITVEVTAEDGTTVQTYTVTVVRAAAASQGTGTAVTPPPSSRTTIQPGQAGSLSLNNKATVSIPAGASEQELQISIEELLNTANLIGADDKLLSPVFELLKNKSENFLTPVKLTFAFDAGAIGDDLKPSVFYYDEDRKLWVEIGGTAEGNRITAEVDHFTKFAVFAVAKAEPEQPEEPELQLSDIAGHWAEAGIKAALQAGIVNGFPDGTFRPDGQVTRAQFAVMLMNALAAQGDGADLAFSDNAQIGSWAKRAVAQAVEAGIINGYEDGSFRPNAGITRAEMVAMVARAIHLAAESGAATSFADDADIPLWARGSAAAAAEHGIVQGRGGNRFAPNANATRAEALTIILNMLEN